MAMTIINQQLQAAISDAEARQEKLAKEQGKLQSAMSKFSKKLAAAIKRSENCKKYIASLLQEERIVEIRSDEKVLNGPMSGHYYVRSDSLNVYGGNYYYCTSRSGCTCDSRKPCKHQNALAARLSDAEKASKFASLKEQYDVRAKEQAARAILEAKRREANDFFMSIALKEDERRKREESPLAGASRGFSLMR